MKRHELLRSLHDLLQPRTYLEIGVSDGRSLALSRTTTIGVDPFFQVTSEVDCHLQLVRATSDEFFARTTPLAHFRQPVADLVFIDGMHLAEYALRDLINVERHTRATSVIVIDDMLPRNATQAGRKREGKAKEGRWAGDVYKLIPTIETLRPDLVCLQLDTTPTGVVVLLLPDPSATALRDAYDDLVEQFVVPDPQHVPEAIRERHRALAPEQLLESPIWNPLRSWRERPDHRARPKVRALLQDAGLTGR